MRVRDRHGRQRSKSFERLSDALEWQGHRRASKDDSIPKSSSPITFDEYALSIPAMHPEWAEGTISGWHSRRKRLERAGLGELRLSEITAGDIQRALANLRSRGLSETTIDGSRGLVTAVYRHAMADELVDSSPTDRLDLLHGTLRIDRQLSDKLGPDKLPANPYPRSRSCSKNRHRNDDEGPEHPALRELGAQPCCVWHDSKVGNGR